MPQIADPTIRRPPAGLAMLALVGPSLIWCAEYIGSGEVVLATRSGAILGISVLWAVLLSIFLKFWIGLSGGIYTVCTGEGMVDMFARVPGPRYWAVWVVLLVQFYAGAMAMGSLASAAGAFIAPLTGLPPFLAGWLATAFAVCVAWTGEFKLLKIVMTTLVAVTVLGILNVASHVLPPFSALLASIVPREPTVPAWAIEQGLSPDPWQEILPLVGWGAGGFASQVWYTYWVLGAKYGAAAETGYGVSANVDKLQKLTEQDGERLRGWCRLI
ncbi:MAG: Nramp family divalent metal transporter, partial [Planctomycetota bacterium]